MSWAPPFDEGYDGMIVVMVMVMVMEIRYVLKSERALVMNKLRGAGPFRVCLGTWYLTWYLTSRPKYLRV